MANFIVTVVDRPAIKAAGIKVRTTMERASVDCPKLWSEEFGPRMCSFPADAARPDESYGLSVMIDSEAFDYWAVMPIADGVAAPDGMDTITIPGGTYAECRVESLAQLGEAFTYIYTAWPATQEKYALNMQGMGCELYTSDFMKNGSLTVYCPLVEK